MTARAKAAAIAHSPLEEMAATSYMKEISGRAKIVLRGKCDDEQFMTAVQNALGLSLPTTVNKRQEIKITVCCAPVPMNGWCGRMTAMGNEYYHCCKTP